MADLPDALVEVERLLGALTIAHEAVFDLHAELVRLGRQTDRTRELLAESARIAVSDGPSTTAPARRLSAQWHEESLLRPNDADTTRQDLEDEVGRAEEKLSRLLARQREIARELASLVERGR